MFEPSEILATLWTMWVPHPLSRAFFYSFAIPPSYNRGAGIAQWLERRTRDWKVAGSNPCRSGGRSFFSRVNFLYWLLFRYPFHPGVTAVARKRSRSFCPKCWWQVTAKHAYTYVCGFPRSDMVHGCMVVWCTTCAETAAVWCGTNHASAVSTPLRWIFKNTL